MFKNIFFLTIALILEVSFTTLPLVLLTLQIIYIFQKKPNIFFLAFIFGILLDIFFIKTIGLTSIFFLLFLLIIILYERKFEIETKNFVLISSFFGSFVFLLIFNYQNIFFQALVSSFISFTLFLIVKSFRKTYIKQRFADELN